MSHEFFATFARFLHIVHIVFHIGYVNQPEFEYSLLLFSALRCKMSLLETWGEVLQNRNQNYLKGAAILASASIFAKIISAIYKIPLFNIMDAEDAGTFQVTYNVFTFILAISTAGIPAALSRLVSSANASGNTKLAKRYFTVALPGFILIGLVAMLIMLFLAQDFADFMNNSSATTGIRVLAPAVFFACIIAVYRGYAQGHENMVPTAMSQIIEVICKAVFGIAAALLLVHWGYQTHIVAAGAITGVTIGLGLSVLLLIWYKRKMDRDAPVISDSVTMDTRSGLSIFGRIMKVSIPITMSSTFMSLMVVIDSRIVLGRLQTVLGFTEAQASAQFGVYALGLAIYNLPFAFVVPVSVSIFPAIAAAIAKGKKDESQIIMQSSLKLVNLISMPAAAGLMALAAPILLALYSQDTPLATNLLTVLGAASFFVCLQYITTATLQANGHERISLITFPIGAAVKISLAYFLSGNPDIGIIASPIGTLACFIVISALNIIFIVAKVKNRPSFRKVFIRPFLCSAIMAGASFGIYRLLYAVGSGIFAANRFAVSVYLAIAVLAGVCVYGALIIVSRTVTMDDMKLVPKGAKIARLLRIR